MQQVTDTVLAMELATSITYNVDGPRFSDEIDFWAEFDLAKTRWMPVDNGVDLPETFVANFLIDEVRLVEMKIVIKDGKAECRSVKFMIRDDQPALTGPQLRVPIDKFVDHACEAIVIRESRRVSWTSDEDRDEAETAIKKVRQKRPMTDDLLMRVAGLYNASPYRKIEKIMEAEGIANSTARLYVSEARKRGILPKTTRGKAT
jgi:hypothetical protein